MSMLQQVRGLRLVLKDELGAVMWGVGRGAWGAAATGIMTTQRSCSLLCPYTSC
jgi:hypothetical protein